MNIRWLLIKYTSVILQPQLFLQKNMYFSKYILAFIFKGAYSNLNSHPPTFFKRMEILVPQVEKGFRPIWKWNVQNLVV